MSEEEVKQPLTGGAQTIGLVRVGKTVRRPRHVRSDFVQALMGHLEAVEFSGAQLVSATTLIRAYHDATATSALRGDQEVVCYGDLGPHNTVFRGDEAVALIDGDGDVRPGRRADDFAHAVWCFADLLEAGVPLDEQARRTHVMCQAYPGMTPAVVIDELAARFRRARAQHQQAARARGVEVFDRMLAWLDAHGQDIATARSAARSPEGGR